MITSTRKHTSTKEPPVGVANRVAFNQLILSLTPRALYPAWFNSPSVLTEVNEEVKLVAAGQ